MKKAQTGVDAGKLRQQLVQARSQISDLEEELQEKNNLYQAAIQDRDTGKARVEQAEEALGNVEHLIKAKVDQARSKEEKKNKEIKKERDIYQRRVKELEDEIKGLKTRLENAKSTNPSLGGGGGNENFGLESASQLQKFAREMDKKDKALQEAQKYSNYL